MTEPYSTTKLSVGKHVGNREGPSINMPKHLDTGEQVRYYLEWNNWDAADECYATAMFLLFSTQDLERALSANGNPIQIKVESIQTEYAREEGWPDYGYEYQKDIDVELFTDLDNGILSLKGNPDACQNLYQPFINPKFDPCWSEHNIFGIHDFFQK